MLEMLKCCICYDAVYQSAAAPPNSRQNYFAPRDSAKANQSAHNTFSISSTESIHSGLFI